jgi:tetratricopeptide (TPR) repeat protein
MEVDRCSDIFSFGVVLYEMITGHLPFKGEHEAAIVYSIVNETPEPLARYKANVPEGLQRAVDKALAKDREERYQHIDDLLADLRHEKRSLEYVKVGQIPAEILAPRVKKKPLRFIVPLAVIFLAVLLFLIFKPFQVEIGPQREAIAEENSLAIMYFENLVDREDEERLGEIVTNLLITDLSESQYIKVVSGQRLYDILKLLGREGVKVIDRDVASEVATKAQAKWMLLGSILQLEPQVILTSQLVEVESGRVMASQRITGESEEKIFSLIDKLTVEVKKDLSLPAKAQKEEDPQVADVTTHSPEAYRYYLEGVDNYYKYYLTEAERSFKKALESDSTFAMAYFRLAEIQGGLEQKKMAAKAVEYSDGVSQKERHYIRSQEARISGNYTQAIAEAEKIVERYPEEKEAFNWLGEIYYQLSHWEEAIRYYNRVIEIDPLYKWAYNSLAYAYNNIGDFDKSIWAINKYISLAPDEANPYDSRADLYAYNGKIEQAIESYKSALEIKPDFYASLAKLGHMYLFKREYARAESCYQELSSSVEKETRSEGRTYLAYIPLYQGKFEAALEVLDHGLAADRMERAEGRQNIGKHVMKATLYSEMKNLELALKEAEKAMELSRRINPDAIVYWRFFYARFLAQNNDFEKAEEVAEAMKKDIEEKDKSQKFWYWYAIGYIELARGNLEASIINFERLAKHVPSSWAYFMLAEAYLASGRLGEAVAEFEKVLSRYDESRALVAVHAVKAHYLLGLAYEKSGWNKKAVKQYEEFLEIWKNADEGIEEVEDARERLEKLLARS